MVLLPKPIQLCSDLIALYGKKEKNPSYLGRS